MARSSLFRLFSFGLLLGTSAHCRTLKPRQESIEQFIATQSDVSIDGVLANIGPDGSEADGVPAGIVIASPSRSDPDYFYTWTRDAALTYKMLIERFIEGDSSLRSTIDAYVSAQDELQSLDTPSGAADSGSLGEPKFNVNLTAFTGSWGRPQRDGPALRATALTTYSNWLVANGEQDTALNSVWPVITQDLSYVVRLWNQTGFDLWEEVNGSSFFTLSATHRALVEGAALASTLGQTCEGCAEAASQVLCFLESFWTGSYIDSNINVNDGRTGKDANSILSSIHTFDPEAECTDATFQPCSSRALANHKAVTDSFRSEYAINSDIPQGAAVAVGRYAEDVYFNGNPWYLTTLAAAEQLYDAVYQWESIGKITVDELSLPFFTDLDSSFATGTYENGSDTFSSIVSAVREYADDYIATVQKYTPQDNAFAEQYDRNTGAPLSATDLTWSYAAFLTATERRAGIVSPSWGEPSNNVPPEVCTSPPACEASITFNVRATTTFGENIFVVGQLTELANWSPENAIALSADGYTSDDPLWSVEIDLPTERSFEYKYIRKSESGEVTWESDPNREYETPADCGSSATIEDTWR